MESQGVTRAGYPHSILPRRTFARLDLPAPAAPRMTNTGLGYSSLFVASELFCCDIKCFFSKKVVYTEYGKYKKCRYNHFKPYLVVSERLVVSVRGKIVGWKLIPYLHGDMLKVKTDQYSILFEILYYIPLMSHVNPFQTGQVFL